MKKALKNVLVLLLALVMVFSMVACSDESESKDVESNPEKTEEKNKAVKKPIKEQNVKAEETEEKISKTDLADAEDSVDEVMQSLCALDFNGIQDYMTDEAFEASFGEIGDLGNEEIISEFLGEDIAEEDADEIMDSFANVMDAMLDYEVVESKEDDEKIIVTVSLKMKDVDSFDQEAYEQALSEMMLSGELDENSSMSDIYVAVMDVLTEMMDDMDYGMEEEGEITLENIDGMWIITSLDDNVMVDESVVNNLQIF